MALRTRRSPGRVGLALATALLLLMALTGFGHQDVHRGGNGGGGELPSKTGPIGSSKDKGSPVEGGVLRVIQSNTDPGGLDPIKGLGSGEIGLNELTAIYDALMRYDPVTNKNVPQLAKSLTANADNSQYTLTLRDGVKFTDGTPLDSAAVKSGFERFSGPDSILTYFAIFPEIVSMETPDPSTVVITLDGPDASFPFLLTQSFGQVVSPTAVAAQGAQDFNLNPVGAGPFKVKSYEPGVRLSVVRNDDYWGPAPHLEGIDFTWVDDDRAKVQALESGDVDVINVNDPVQSVAAFESGAAGFGWLAYASPVVSMNMREGAPFADQRLRQAVAYALDPGTINTRVFEGLASPSKKLFPTGLLKSGAPGMPTKVKEARTLVQSVKDETGWDGSFTLLALSDPAQHDLALTIQAMLNNVGFKAEVQTPPDFTDRVYVNFDFDAVVTALALLETDPYAFLVYEAGGAFSPTGFEDPRMDAALLELRGASTSAETRAATKKIQEIWNDVIPSVWLGTRVERMFHTSKVHGLVPSASVVTLYDKAWLSG
jgi:peptide/nickel transport system substrate-binding protein